MGEWSPSHLIVAAIAVATVIGQLIMILTRLKTITERLEKRIDRQDETIKQHGEAFFHALERHGETFFHALERHEERMDKRLAEIHQRLSDMDANIRQLNQNHIDHLNRHHVP